MNTEKIGHIKISGLIQKEVEFPGGDQEKEKIRWYALCVEFVSKGVWWTLKLQIIDFLREYQTKISWKLKGHTHDVLIFFWWLLFLFPVHRCYLELLRQQSIVFASILPLKNVAGRSKKCLDFLKKEIYIASWLPNMFC